MAPLSKIRLLAKTEVRVEEVLVYCPVLGSPPPDELAIWRSTLQFGYSVTSSDVCIHQTSDRTCIHCHLLHSDIPSFISMGNVQSLVHIIAVANPNLLIPISIAFYLAERKVQPIKHFHAASIFSPITMAMVSWQRESANAAQSLHPEPPKLSVD